MKVYLTRWTARFTRRESLDHERLVEAVARAERGLVDADLGGGLIKQRVARAGKGRSGGYRTIIAYREGVRAVVLLGFAKNDIENINADELRELRLLGSNWLNATDDGMEMELDAGNLVEVSAK